MPVTIVLMVVSLLLFAKWLSLVIGMELFAARHVVSGFDLEAKSEFSALEYFFNEELGMMILSRMIGDRSLHGS